MEIETSTSPLKHESGMPHTMDSPSASYDCESHRYVGQGGGGGEVITAANTPLVLWSPRSALACPLPLSFPPCLLPASSLLVAWMPPSDIYFPTPIPFTPSLSSLPPSLPPFP